MTKKEETTFLKRVEIAKSNRIFVEEEINPYSHIRGVYCFFAKKVEEEIPFYIGKSNDIFIRLFGRGSAHLTSYLRGVRNTGVHKRIEEFIRDDYSIEVRILKKVEYKGDGFIQDANRLALAELEAIVNQQSKGFCVTKDQISEAVKIEYEQKEWEDKFAK